MMPTFPRSPLKSRTVSFPQYGFKAGLSDSALAHVLRVKPAPGIPCATPALRPSFVHPSQGSLIPAQSREGWLKNAPPCEEISPLPQRPSLRSGLSCPGPSSLNRPHAPHSWAHRNFAAMRFICDAFAVRVRLGDPRVVPCFHWHPLSTCCPLRPREVHRLHMPSSFADNAGLRPGEKVSALPKVPTL